ncbi:MAG: hypothetical protein C0402_02415 [Thermodesulfovibrio sp.]|nr:hypothetical protein [Thermodesulfovibrio sp.]
MRGFIGVVVISILFFPSITLSHPGKTDRRGGHECKKDCSAWDLYVGEYHLHEEDLRPIKTEKNLRPKSVSTPDQKAEKPGPKPPELAPPLGNNLTRVLVEENKAVLPIPEPATEEPAAIAPKPSEPEGFFMDQPWLLMAALGLILLLVALIARRIRSG